MFKSRKRAAQVRYYFSLMYINFYHQQEREIINDSVLLYG